MTGIQEGSRLILVSFAEESLKSAVLQKAKNIAGLNISFSNDMTRELREKKKIQYQNLREALVILEQRGKKAVIKGQNIIMDNAYHRKDKITMEAT